MKIFTYTDLSIRADQLFWHRDLGLLTKAFRELGHDAWLVVHPASDFTPHPSPAACHDPIIWAPPANVRNPSWWQSQKPDLVILGLWTRPKYDPIRRAALSATPRVIERADSDGMRTASCGLKEYAQRRYDYCRDKIGRWPVWISVACSLFYSFACILATPWIEARLARTLKLLPALVVETPQAMSLWRRLAGKLRADPNRIHFIPHPIQTDIFHPAPTLSPKNQTISVGRWGSHQKDLPRLLQTLTNFLKLNPNSPALVVGPGLRPPPPHPRMSFVEYLSPSDLARQMQESKFFVSASRYESFGLAAAEALCCGCIPLGPPEVAAFRFFQSFVPPPWNTFQISDLNSRLPAAWQKVHNHEGITPPEILLSPKSVALSFLETCCFTGATLSAQTFFPDPNQPPAEKSPASADSHGHHRFAPGTPWQFGASP